MMCLAYFDRLDGVAKSKPDWSRNKRSKTPTPRISPRKRKVEAAKNQRRICREPARTSASQAEARSGAVRLFENHRAVCGRRDAALRQPRRLGASRNQFQHAGHADRAVIGRRQDPVSDSGPNPTSTPSASAIRSASWAALNRTFPGTIATFAVDVR